MIDPKQIDITNLINILSHDRPWLKNVDIVQTERKGEGKICLVRFAFRDARDGTEDECFLRHSKGPHQHHFWDIYGDNYDCPELALLALLGAQPPPPVMGQYFCAKYVIPLKDKDE